MTWEQKFAALKALSTDMHLTTTTDGDKWVCSGRGIEETSDTSCVLASVTGWGATPEAAVENLWLRVEKQSSDHYFVLGAYSESRRHVKWNGFMWVDVPIRKALAS